MSIYDSKRTFEKSKDYSVSVSFSILFICAAVPATYPFIFSLRHKILKRVEERQYSETTKRLHFDLLKVLVTREKRSSGAGECRGISIILFIRHTISLKDERKCLESACPSMLG